MVAVSSRVKDPALPVLVAGFGVTGRSVARFFANRGTSVEVWDEKAVTDDVVLHRDIPENMSGFSRLVLSPGVPANSELARCARDAGISVTSDIEVFLQVADAPVIGVTGSNGKSTVTTLIAHLLQAAGHEALAGGNLGPAALDLLESPRPDFYVLELSSFQLETTSNLSLAAGVVTNISIDHLDRHSSVERYAEIKAQVLRCADAAVFNRDDRRLAKVGAGLSRAIGYGLDVPAAGDFGLRDADGEAWFAKGEATLMPVRTLGILGRHNQSNALAALAVLDALGIESSDAAAALADFPGLPHRTERLADIDGVTYVNDSKATNPASTIAALEGFDEPVLLLAGGDSKGADFSDLARAVEGRVRMALVFGRDGARLAEALAGTCPVTTAADLDAAFEIAKANARPGDLVLLSPACASLDQFTSFAARGDAFRALVEAAK